MYEEIWVKFTNYDELVKNWERSVVEIHTGANGPFPWNVSEVKIYSPKR